MPSFEEPPAACHLKPGAPPSLAQILKAATPRWVAVPRAAAPSAQVRKAKAKARRETLRDKLARKLEEHADEVVAAYLRDPLG
jgi:hypothetical protein